MLRFNYFKPFSETINNCMLLADSGYLSYPYQIDLFNSVQIKD